MIEIEEAAGEPKSERASGVSFMPIRLAKIAEGIGLLGLVGFALTVWLIPAGYQIALGVSAAACLLSAPARSVLTRDRMFGLFLIFAVFILAEAWRGATHFPAALQRQWTDAGKWLLLFGFLIIGWWLNADLRRINAVLLTALLGFLIGMLHSARWEEVIHFHTDWQTGFQMAASTSGLISVTAILGLLLFIPRIFGAAEPGWRFALKAAVWLVLLYLCAFALVASQSRATWLAAAIVFPPVLGYRYFQVWRASETSVRHLPVLALLALFLLAGGVFINADSLSRRTGADLEVVASLLKGRTADLPESSFAYRYQVQRFGLEKWLERPWLGWGAGASRPLIAASGRPELYNHQFGQWMASMHNAYLEILVRFGLAGAAFFAAIAWYLIRSLAEARRLGRLPEDYWLFLAASLAITGIWGFGSHFLVEAWRGYWLLLAGMIYTFTLQSRQSSETRRRASWF